MDGVWWVLLPVLLTAIILLYRNRTDNQRLRAARLVDALVDGTSEGVLEIDERGRAARSNAAARALLVQRQRAATWTVASAPGLAELVEAAHTHPV